METFNEQYEKCQYLANDIYNASGLYVDPAAVFNALYGLRASVQDAALSIMRLQNAAVRRKGSKANPLRFKDIAKRI